MVTEIFGFRQTEGQTDIKLFCIIDSLRISIFLYIIIGKSTAVHKFTDFFRRHKQRWEKVIKSAILTDRQKVVKYGNYKSFILLYSLTFFLLFISQWLVVYFAYDFKKLRVIAAIWVRLEIKHKISLMVFIDASKASKLLGYNLGEGGSRTSHYQFIYFF